MSDESMSQSAQPLERRLATILCADVAGYSKMMAANEDRTVRVFRGHREIFESLIKLHRGRIFNTAGDAVLAEFNSAVEAVRCATEIQAALRTRNDHLAPEEKMQFRMGINLGDVIVQGGDLLGDGVNVAARIQTATAPGGICISGSVHDQIQNKLSLDFKLLGEQTYKNIAKPVRTYSINENEGVAVTAPARRTGWRVLAASGATAMAIVGASYWGYQEYEARRAEQVRVDAGFAVELAAQKRDAELAAQKRVAELAAQKRDAELAAQKQAAELAAQKQATEQAQRAAEEAKRAAQLQAQKLVAEEERRRARDERAQLEQERKRLEADRRSAEIEKRQTADEALRRAQGERTQLEQERKRLEAERHAADAARTQADASRRSAATVAKDAPKLATPYDGTYSGRLCNEVPKRAPFCWPVPLVVRNGIAEGSWIRGTNKTASARGTVAEDGLIQLNLASWAPNGAPVEAILRGRITNGAVTASGKWIAGAGITGEWKRTP